MTVAIYRPTTGAISVGAVAALTGNGAESMVPALTLLDTDGSSYVTSLRTHRGSFTTDVYAPTLTQRATSNYRASARGSIQDTNGGVASFSAVARAESGTNNWSTIAVELRSV